MSKIVRAKLLLCAGLFIVCGVIVPRAIAICGQ